MKRTLTPVCLLFLILPAAAQQVDRDAFRKTDSLVSAAGAMPDSSLKSILHAITPLCSDQTCLVRAMYMWTAKNIAWDCATAQHPERGNNSSSYVLAKRSANSNGYAGLIADMCRLMHIECDIVAGVAKRKTSDIGHVDNDAGPHYWNVVHTKERIFVLDAAWGAGDCDGREAVPDMTDAWFITNRKLFALSHYPQDKRKQLLDTPVERSAFVSAPVVGVIAPILCIFPVPGQRGALRGRAGDSLQLSFTVRPQPLIDRIYSCAAIIDGEKRDINFIKDADILKVIIPFPEHGEYPVILMVNNKMAYGFRAEVSAGARRRR